MAYNVPSKYQPLWDAIRTSKSKCASIVALPVHHKTIIKAVIKRKDKDLAFKQECLDAGFSYILSYTTVENRIDFKLTKNKVTLEDI